MDFLSAVRLAVGNIAVFGDTDIFPVPLEHELFVKFPDSMAKAVEKLHLQFDALSAVHPPESIRSLVLVGHHGFRLGTQLDPVWNAYYLALALAIAPAIEKVRVPVSSGVVFSYRHGGSGEGGRIFDANVSWPGFIQRTRALCEESAFCALADITEFYHRITVEKVDAALSCLNLDSYIRERLLQVLRALDVDAQGLPVGGPASRILAELVLVSIDNTLIESGVRYCRFVDDFRFFSDTEEDARILLLKAARLLQEKGFFFQKSKTRIVRVAELLDELQVTEMLDFSKKGEFLDVQASKNPRLVLLQHDPYSELQASKDIRLEEFASRPDSVEVIQREFAKRRLNVSLAKQVLTALNFLPTEKLDRAVQALFNPQSLMGIGAVFSRVLQLLCENLPRLSTDTRRQLVARIQQLMLEDAYLFQVELHCILALRILRLSAAHPHEFDERLTDRIYAATGNPLVRREVLLFLLDAGNFAKAAKLPSMSSPKSRWDQRTLFFIKEKTNHSGSFDGKAALRHDLCDDALIEWLSSRLPTSSNDL